MTTGADSPGHQARSAARLAAVQALYQIAIGGQSGTEVIAEFVAHRLGAETDGVQYADADADHFAAVVHGVIDNAAAVERLITAAAAQGWGANRLEITLRAVLSAAAYELLERVDVPARVVIAEYVDLTRSFFDEAGKAAFVNDVLDTWARELRSAEMAAAAPPRAAAK
jgi:N utilization substance protein B